MSNAYGKPPGRAAKGASRESLNRSAVTDSRSLDHSHTKGRRASKQALNQTATEYSAGSDMNLLQAKQTFKAMKNDSNLLSNRIQML